MRYVMVECLCGNLKAIRYSSIRGGYTTSCGCAKRRSKPLTKELILSRVVEDSNGCWIWQGSTRGQMGYGQVNYKREDGLGKQDQAHRASWKAFNGEIPEGKLVLHRCNVTLCCNPSHLYVGDYSDNMHDAWNSPNNESMRDSIRERIRSGTLKKAFDKGRSKGQPIGAKAGALAMKKKATKTMEDCE